MLTRPWEHSLALLSLLLSPSTRTQATGRSHRKPAIAPVRPRTQAPFHTALCKTVGKEKLSSVLPSSLLHSYLASL